MNTVGATEDISLFQFDCVCFQIAIGFLQIVFLLLSFSSLSKEKQGKVTQGGRNVALFRSIKHTGLVPTIVTRPETECVGKEHPECRSFLLGAETRVVPQQKCKT